MGLSLSVMCRCFFEGKARPPFPDQIVVDEDGFLALKIPDQGKRNLFSDWVESGCEHPRMTYASQLINWTAYRSFQQALEVAGWEHFPTLRSELPNVNGGTTSAAAASAMLEELTFFVDRADLGWTTVLIETDTGEELHEYVAAYNGEFKIGLNGHNFGVNENGFFIREVAGRESSEVFRAMRVEQVLPDRCSLTPGGAPMVEYLDLDSGLRYSCSEPMVKIAYRPHDRLQDAESPFRLECPLRMHVIRRKKEASEFKSVVNSLRTVFEAAVETGNLIRWY